MLSIREEAKEHKEDDRLKTKQAQDEADKVAYMNHMSPTNRTAGIIQSGACRTWIKSLFWAMPLSINLNQNKKRSWSLL